MPIGLARRAVRDQLARAGRSTVAGAGQHVLGLPARPHDELPDARARGRWRRPSATAPTRSARAAIRRCGRRSSSASRPATRRPSAGSAVDACELNDGMAAHLLAQPVGDLAGERRAPRASRSGAAARCRRRTRRRPGRAGCDSSTMRSPRRAASRTLWVTKSDGQAAVAPERARARRGGGRGSSRRARRTARPSAGRRRPGRAPGPARPAGACRPTARAGACRRSPSRCTELEQLARPASVRSALRHACAACSASSTLPATVSHGNSADSWNISAGPAARRRPSPAVGWSRPARG